MAAASARVDLDGNTINSFTICMIGAGGFIGSHLCEKLLTETPHTVLVVDVYNDKIKHLLEPDSLPWAGRIQFHRSHKSLNQFALLIIQGVNNPQDRNSNCTGGANLQVTGTMFD
ncbi:hypothetical protein L2E82_27773 [Cichorium intybus]|uniref:Uncharacterized protein n=1 Tax=Cichorium intybus TaxID=13427 RepID=A0ACB9CU28_CICIN|nr:hypothetical protein L2E82_27773 [Cichorium intybus]